MGRRRRGAENAIWRTQDFRAILERRRVLESERGSAGVTFQISTPGQDTREDGHATADTPGTGHSGHTDSGHAHLGYPEGFRSVVVIAKVGASRDETKTQARKSSQLM